MCTTLEKSDITFLELNKLFPRSNSLFAFFEAIDLQREYSVATAYRTILNHCLTVFVFVFIQSSEGGGGGVGRICVHFNIID